MTELLCYSRNRCSSVEMIDETTLRSICRLQDSLTDAVVEIHVRLPDLEIVDVRGGYRRPGPFGAPDPAVLEKIVGVRIGPGLAKIARGLVGESEEFDELIRMLEECCSAVIVAFTRETLVPCPKDPEENCRFFRKMVQKSIRLYNRCAAFAPGSAVVEGIDPPH